jgi:hypothetical protein
MMPRSTRCFLCLFLCVGGLVTLWTTPAAPENPTVVIVRQMHADADAPQELRRQEAAKNQLVPLAWLTLGAGTLAVVLFPRRKQTEMAKS